jgi:hypothetical protein
MKLLPAAILSLAAAAATQADAASVTDGRLVLTESQMDRITAGRNPVLSDLRLIPSTTVDTISAVTAAFLPPPVRVCDLGCDGYSLPLTEPPPPPPPPSPPAVPIDHGTRLNPVSE